MDLEKKDEKAQDTKAENFFRRIEEGYYTKMTLVNSGNNVIPNNSLENFSLWMNDALNNRS